MNGGSFDSLFSTGKFQIMKVLLPCLPEDKRGPFAILIRIQELLFTMDAVNAAGHGIKMSPPPEGDALFDALLPYCDPAEEAQVQRIRQTFRQMEQMKEMMEMANALQDLFPEGMNAGDMDLAQMASVLSGFQETKAPEKENQEDDDHGTMDAR